MTTDLALPAVPARAEVAAPVDAPPRPAELALTALVVVALAETLRTLYPLGYSLVGDLGFVVTPLVLLLVFLAPLLSPLVAHAGPRAGLWVAVGLVAGARSVLQVAAPPSLVVGVGATVLALVGSSVVVATVLRAPRGPLTVTAGVLLGLGVDVALKGAYALWDRVWQPTADAALVTAFVVAGLCAATFRALRRGLRVGGEPHHGQARRMFALVVLLMPAMLLFASPAFVGSSAGSGVLAATMVPLLGSAVALVVVALLGWGGGPSRYIGVVAGLALAIASWAIAVDEGAAVAVWAVVGMVLLGVLLLAVLAPPADGPEAHEDAPGSVGAHRRTALGATAGFVAMFALTLLYPMHYEMPLPVPNTVLPALAVLLAMVGLVGQRTALPPTPMSSWLLLPTAGLAVLAGSVALWLTASAAEPRPLVAATPDLQVATFNVDQGARENGALDFATVAESIDGLDSDLVALQEVGRGWPLSGMNDLAGWLRQTHGMQLHFAPAADHQFGNALVTRVVLDEVRTLPLPKGDGSMERSAVVATLDTPGGSVTVFALHLQHRNTTAGIEARAAELDVVLRTWDGAPRTIVLGDFNADNRRPDGGGAKLLEGPGHENTLAPLLDAGFVTTQSTTVCTVPTSNDNCSDFVFVTADLLQQPPVEVLDEQGVGDHRPVRSAILVTMPD